MTSTLIGQSSVVATFQTPIIVGAGDQWGDSSDATYATLKTNTAILNTDGAKVDLDATAVSATTFSVLIRASSTTPTGDLVRDPELIWDVSGWDLGFGGLLSVPADGGIHDFTHTLIEDDLTFGDYDPSLFAANIGDGLVSLRARASLGSTGSPRVEQTITVYEFHLYAETGETPTSLRWLQPPLRLHPRNDGLGMSSAPRVDANRSM